MLASVKSGFHGWFVAQLNAWSQPVHQANAGYSQQIQANPFAVLGNMGGVIQSGMQLAALRKQAAQTIDSFLFRKNQGARALHSLLAVCDPTRRLCVAEAWIARGMTWRLDVLVRYTQSSRGPPSRSEEWCRALTTAAG